MISYVWASASDRRRVVVEIRNAFVLFPRTLPEANSLPPENEWLEDEIPFT